MFDSVFLRQNLNPILPMKSLIKKCLKQDFAKINVDSFGNSKM